MIGMYIAVCAFMITVGITAVVFIRMDSRDVWKDTEWERYEED